MSSNSGQQSENSLAFILTVRREFVPSHFSNLTQMNFARTSGQEAFLSKVNEVCRSLRDYEQECYLAERMNDRLIPSFERIGMLGCPISSEYGGAGYDALTYLMAIERIGREGASMRTFFSAHISIGQLVLQSWATEDQKRRYLPDTVTGKKIMAFALTEPAAGSDPLSMTTSFETGSKGFVLKGRKHWIGNGTFAGVMTTYAKDRNTGKVSAFIVEGDPQGLRTEEMKN